MTTLEQLKAQAAAYLADADRRAARAATRRGTAGVTMVNVTTDQGVAIWTVLRVPTPGGKLRGSIGAYPRGTTLVVTIAEPAPTDHGAMLDRRRALAQEHATADWPAHTP